MSSQLFGRLQRHVEAGALPGLVALAARGDEATIEALGVKTFGDTEPMQQDSIFRIASLSKPIAAVVAMMMIDDGTFRLDDVVDDLLPELAGHRVLRSIESPLDDTVAASRPITIEDVLTGRIGFGTIMAAPSTYPVQDAEVDLGLMTLTQPWPPSPLTPDEWIARLGSLPFLSQPGERWHYNTSSQVLGVLLERAGGKPFEAVLRERLLDPLGMPDTSFFVPPDKLARFTTAYAPDPETGAVELLDRNDQTSWWSRPPAMPSAAGWMVSTVDDYWAFARLMVHRGEHQGRTLLSKDSFDQMTTDHLTAEQRDSSALFLGDHGSWGLGLGTSAAGDPYTGIPGGFGWDGGTGTTWRTDPINDVTGILFTQRAMTSPEPPVLYDDFWECVAEV